MKTYGIVGVLLLGVMIAAGGCKSEPKTVKSSGDIWIDVRFNDGTTAPILAYVETYHYHYPKRLEEALTHGIIYAAAQMSSVDSYELRHVFVNNTVLYIEEREGMKVRRDDHGFAQVVIREVKYSL